MVAAGLSILSLVLILKSCKTQNNDYIRFVEENNTKMIKSIESNDSCNQTNFFSTKAINYKYFKVNNDNKCIGIRGPFSMNEIALFIDSEQPESYSEIINTFFSEMKSKNEKAIFIYLLYKNKIETDTLYYLDEYMKLAYSKFDEFKPIISFYYIENASDAYEARKRVPVPPK